MIEHGIRGFLGVHDEDNTRVRNIDGNIKIRREEFPGTFGPMFREVYH